MASEPTLDLERLAAAISDDQPTGSYLRDTDYDRLQRAKDQRAVAMNLERKQRELANFSEDDLMMIPEEDRDHDSPDWRPVRESCTEILANHSKDLWVASWLIEANARLSGFAGLRDGYRLAAMLTEKYWDHLYPPPDEEEGFLGTVSQLTSLNGEEGPGTLLIPIESIPLIPGRAELTFSAYRQAIEGAGGDYTESEFLAAARQADPDRLRDQADDIEGAIEAFEAMNESLAEKCGTLDGVAVAPPSSQIRRALKECQRAFRLITRDVLSAASAASEDAAREEGSVALSPSAIVDPAQAQVTNREEAFRLLLRASEFFRKTEPHSPVSYMLQQAVRFGRMELPDLLQELIKDEQVLKNFAERTGVELTPPQEE